MLNFQKILQLAYLIKVIKTAETAVTFNFQLDVSTSAGHHTHSLGNSFKNSQDNKYSKNKYSKKAFIYTSLIHFY